MKTVRHSKLSRLLFLLILVLMESVTSGCSITRYTDGPLTQYLAEPIPKLNKPIARSLSLEKVEYNTAGGMEGIMISDLVAREIYLVPEDVGREVKKLLKLDEEFSKEATYAALNTLAKNRAKARQVGSNKTALTPPSTITANTSTERYIQSHERMAKEAYRKGDYLRRDIHASAAMNARMIDQSFAQAQASVDLAFGVLGAMAAAGKAIITNDFIKLRNWIEFDSGAIGTEAPKGSHLSVFLLRFFDAKSFQLDSRNRVAVFLVLIDKNGVSKSVLEGSDILVCEKECNLFQPKPTAKVVEKPDHSEDVQKQYWTAEGTQYLGASGFDATSGFYEYILLQHGLKKLSKDLR